MSGISLCTRLAGSARNRGMKTTIMLLAALVLAGPSWAQDKPDKKKEEKPKKVVPKKPLLNADLQPRQLPSQQSVEK